VDCHINRRRRFDSKDNKAGWRGRNCPGPMITKLNVICIVISCIRQAVKDVIHISKVMAITGYPEMVA